MANIFRSIQNRDKTFALMLERYLQLEEEYELARAALTFKGKTIVAAVNDQAEWPIFVDERLAELKMLCKKLETTVEMIRGDISRELKGSALDPGRDITKFIDRDDRFLDMNEQFLMFEELREKYVALSGAWTTRGYSVKNRVDLMIHQIKDNLL